MLLFSLAILGGLLFLVLSADRFVNGSVALARDLGVSPFIIGLTIIAFGTSAPEMIVSATAALSGASELAVGNAIGSNIANIGLVLGVTAIISTLPIDDNIVKKELPLLAVMTLLAGSLLLDNYLSVMDGVILLTLLAISLFLISRGSTETQELLEEVEEAPEMNVLKASFVIIISLLILLASAKMLVWGGTGVARYFGVSELVIGLTIVAIGTSLPELAASVASALKGHHEMAIGNVIGSNLFNLLAVLPLPALISPTSLNESVLLRDYAVMCALTFALLILSIIIKNSTTLKGLGKVSGIVLLISYSVYLYSLYRATLH